MKTYNINKPYEMMSDSDLKYLLEEATGKVTSFREELYDLCIKMFSAEADSEDVENRIKRVKSIAEDAELSWRNLAVSLCDRDKI